MKFCVLLAINNIVYDARVRRLAAFFVRRLGPGRVTVVGLATGPVRPGDFADLEGVRIVLAPRPFHFLPLSLARVALGMLVYALTALRAVRVLLSDAKGEHEGGLPPSAARESQGLIWATDADTLPLGWLLARMSRSRLVYDAHEYWPALGRKRGLVGRLQIALERLLIGRAERIYTVSQSMARAYQLQYALARLPVVLYNSPQPPETAEPPVRLTRQDRYLLLYQGFLASDRRIEEFLEIFDRLPLARRFELVFVGMGPLEASLRARKQVYAAVPANRLLAVTATADAGLLLLDPDNPNHCLTVSNKLLEYLAVGLPVLTTGCGEEANQILERHGRGAVFHEYSEAAIGSALAALLACLEQPSSPGDPFCDWASQERQLEELWR